MNTWHQLEDGRIEVNGGIPVLVEGLTLTDLRNELDLYGATVAAAAERYRFPAAVAMGILHAEGTVAIARQRHLPREASARILSPAGAIGPMQLMPATAKSLGVADPLDPEQNIDGGVKYLRDQRARFGSDVPTLAGSYNAGHPIRSSSSPWGIHAEGTYIDRVVAATNTVIGLGGVADGAGYSRTSRADIFLRGALALVALVGIGWAASEVA